MLPRENRLKNKKDFEKVFKKGEGFKQDFLFLKISKNNLNFIRFGFVISKKISKKAIIRNKIKRRLSEIIRMDLPEIKKGWDGIIITSPGIETKGFEDLKENLENLFKKARLLQ